MESPRISNASGLKDRVAETVARNLDPRRSTVALGLEVAAASLRKATRLLPGARPMARPAFTTADSLDAAANYVRNHDVRAIATDAGQRIKRHPGAALLTAAALGFLLARALRR